MEVLSAAQLGLQLLVQPGAGNLLLRGACKTVGVIYPIYASVKALEYNDEEEQKLWLTYWTAFGCFSLVEAYSDKFLRGLPLYLHLKLLALLWLQIPPFNGSKKLYMGLIRPLLIKHREKIDSVVETSRQELIQFSMKHHDDICKAFMAAKDLVVQAIRKVMISARHLFDMDSENEDL